MKVAYICTDEGVPVCGAKGCSVHVQEVIRAMLRRGYGVEVFASRWGGDPPADWETVKKHALARSADAPHAANAPPTCDLEQTRREQGAQQVNASLASLLHRTGPFDLIYERHALWSFGAMEFAAQQGVCSVLEVNAPLVAEQLRHRHLLDEATAVALSRRAFQAAGVIAAVSQGAADYVLSLGGDAARIHVIPNGVDPGRFAPPAHGRKSRPFTVGFVGTMKAWHGIDILLAAFERLKAMQKEAELLLVGDGPYRQEIERWLSGSSAALQQSVTLVGAIPPADVPRYLQRMDAAVLCPPDLGDYYFSPLKLFEYMAAGRAIVASQIGQIEEVIDHEVHGLLTPPGDVAALVAALNRLANDAALRSRLGQAARAQAIERHTWEAVLDRLAVVVPCMQDAPLGASK